VRFEVGEGPRLEPLDRPEKVQTLALQADFGKLEPVYEALRRVRWELDPGVALIGFAERLGRLRLIWWPAKAPRTRLRRG